MPVKMIPMYLKGSQATKIKPDTNNIKELAGCPCFATSMFDFLPKTGLPNANQIIAYHLWQKYKAAVTSLPIDYITGYCYFFIVHLLKKV
jgi:hypothetical protein